MTLTPASDFEPLELFSASGLSSALLGARVWAFRYIMGLKEPETLWSDIKDVPKPKPKVSGKPTDDEKRALRAFNKKRRPALGKQVHERIEAYYGGAEVDWSDEPGRIALAGLPCLPAPDECAWFEVEADISIDLTFMGAGCTCCSLDNVHLTTCPMWHSKDPIVFRGKRDLLTVQTRHYTNEEGEPCEGDLYLLIDHKSTYTFDYIDREKTIKTVKTPEQLRADPQANLYALDVMQKYGLTQLACRWVYYRTEGDPASLAVDFTITRAEAEANVAELVKLATRLRDLMRQRKQPNDIECDVESCGKYGGCPYHPDQGGPCTPPVLTMGERLVKLHAKKGVAKAAKSLPQLARENHQKKKALSAKKEDRNMAGLGFRDRQKAREIAAAETAATTGEGPSEVVDTQGEEQTDHEQERAAADAMFPGEKSDGTEPVQEDPAVDPADIKHSPAADGPSGSAPARRGRPPGKPRAVAAAPVGGSLSSTIAELASELADNEAEHRDIKARMIAALGGAA